MGLIKVPTNTLYISGVTAEMFSVINYIIIVVRFTFVFRNYNLYTYEHILFTMMLNI